MRQRASAIHLALLMLVTGVACDNEPNPTGLGSQPIAAIADTRSMRRFIGLEALFDSIASDHPSFAGIHADPISPNRDLVLSLVDTKDSANVTSRLRQLLPKSRRGGRVRVEQVRHSFRQLADWREALFAAHSNLMLSDDLDERENRIRFGTRSAENLLALRAAARALGIPEDGYDVAVVAAPSLRADLNDKVRPVGGGLAIAWGKPRLYPEVCSVGVNGEWSFSSAYRGFLTASHCTRLYMGLDPNGTNYFQDEAIGTGTLIGTEFDDPAYFTGGSCPSGARCRFSDVAFVKYSNAATSGLGTIMRTTSASNNGTPGSTTIAGQFTIVGDWPYSILGEELQKVGRTTGWTYGTTTATCANYLAQSIGGINYWVFCSDRTNIHSWGGDSGAPIFKWYGGSDTTVYWAGILWGGPIDDPNTTYHSPKVNIDLELTGSYGWYW